jgi:hypothetical protein
LILSVLYRSLARTGRASTRLRRRLNRLSKGRSLQIALLAARLQEADALVTSHLRRDDKADRLIGRRLGGWAFHR